MSYLPCLGDPSTPVIFPASVRHHLEVCKAQSQFPITLVSPLYDKSVIKDVQLYMYFPNWFELFSTQAPGSELVCKGWITTTNQASSSSGLTSAASAVLYRGPSLEVVDGNERTSAWTFGTARPTGMLNNYFFCGQNDQPERRGENSN